MERESSMGELYAVQQPRPLGDIIPDETIMYTGKQVKSRQNDHEQKRVVATK
jgi:hypothetical protein